MRVVLDTNIVVSSLISKDTAPYFLYRAWRHRRFDLLTSASQLAEIEQVLARPQLQKNILPQEAQEIILGLRTEAEHVDTDAVRVTLSPDPDDNRILAIAVAGHADYVVSGDKADMLSLGEVSGIPIITARHAVNILGYDGV